MSDVEKIVNENSYQVRKQEEKRERLCRKINRQFSRMAYWFSGITTVLTLVTLACKTWGTGALLALATVLVLICGRVLED